MFIVNYLKKYSLRFKMLAISSLTVIVALVTSFLILMVMEFYLHYAQAEKQLNIVGKTASNTVHSSLVFDDEIFANQAMKIFRIEKNIQVASLFRKDGSLFAQYYRDKIIKVNSPQVNDKEGIFRHGLLLTYMEKLYLDKKLIGFLSIRYELISYLKWMFYKALILILVFMISAALAYRVWSKFQPSITHPIFLLLTYMDKITKKHDYSLHVPKQANDELGQLIDGFNEMLLQIRNRDQLLEKHAKQLELRIAERTHDLLQEKLKAETANRCKSDFLATMSHEIRTPLNGVIGLTQLLTRQNLSIEQNKIVEKLNISASLLLQLINDVLDLAKIESGKLNLEYTNFSMRTILDESMISFENSATEKGLELVSKFDPSIPELLLGDPNRISQILLNLVSNAIKFTASGMITVTVDISEDTEHEVVLVLLVMDTGIGISKEQQANIFTNFTQADTSISRQYGGTGLGLSICKHLVELMGGTINLESNTGKGSTFRCQFPLAKPLKAEKSLEQKTYTSNYKDLHVLVVDDEEINRYLTKGLLETEGIQVSLAESGKVALEMAEKQAFDLILMDLHMPILNGWDTTRLFRSSSNDQLANIPIIGVTADVLKESRDLCYEAGMNLVVSKPFQFSDLFEQIQTLLAKAEDAKFKL